MPAAEVSVPPRGMVDRGAPMRAWRAVLATPAWGGAPVWLTATCTPPTSWFTAAASAA
jgi:hypothetical protein